jgi:hypothetical protein
MRLAGVELAAAAIFVRGCEVFRVSLAQNGDEWEKRDAALVPPNGEIRGMNRILIATLMLVGAQAAHAGNYYSSPRPGGGTNYYGSDGSSAYTAPRAGGGYNYYGSNGTNGYAVPRAGGGTNYYDSNGGSGYAVPRAGGGSNYYYTPGK